MDKKKIILIRILHSLIPYRKLAEWLIVFLMEADFSEEILDGMTQLIYTASKKYTSQQQQAAFSHWLNLIEKIKNIEAQQHDQEEDELDLLLQQIDDVI